MNVFPFEPNAGERLKERRGYLTEIQRSWDHHEKRIQKRRMPTGSIEYQFLMDDVIEAELLSSLLYDAQDELWIMPLWHYATRVTSDVADTDTVIQVPTADIPFLDPTLAQPVILWRDRKTYDLHSLQAFDASTVTFGDPAIGAWPANVTYLIPCRVARLEPDIRLAWVNNGVLRGTILATFAADVVSVGAGPEFVFGGGGGGMPTT